MVTTDISHYRLLNLLGEGGMGVVYRAEDLRLGREVAVKLLRPEAVQSAEWLARFEREARLASSLQHPSICTIHELGDHQGQPFIVMELLEGRTIKQALEDGPLSLARLVDYARQAAAALDAAHRRGIVHRDIKPANLFVTQDRLKILDFGLAKLSGEDAPGMTAARSAPTATRSMSPDLTRTGSTVGTAAYMSPEQAQGRPVDARTDLFSLGAVIYEMATGRRAFGGDDVPLIVMRILNGIVVPLRTVNDTLPQDLETIVQKLMAVDPQQRYQSAAELLADLDALDERTTAAATPSRTVAGAAGGVLSSRRRRAVAALVVAVMAGVGITAATWLRAAPALSDRDSLMIGALENTTGDSVFDETLVTALKVHLGQSPFLDIVPDQRIRETLESMNRPADTRLTHEVAREACQRLSVKAMLDGSIAPLGSHYVLTLNATDCATGESLVRQQAEASSKERVLTELGRVSSRIRAALGESLPSVQRFDIPIEQATTPSLPALKAYALGLEERRRGRELESVAFFNQAIELDADFAAAHTTLSTVYGSLGEWQRSEDYARKAFGVRRRVSERERLFITYQFHDRVTGDQEKAAETLELWKASYPRDFRPANALALIHNRMGRYDRAAAEAQEALRRSPDHPFPLSNLAFAYRALGRADAARATAERAVALGVETVPTRRLLYQLAIVQGDGSAAGHVAWARDRAREFDLVSAQAQAAAFHGKLREASQLYARAADLALARGLAGTASGYAAHHAWTIALYDERRKAAAEVRRLIGPLRADDDPADSVPRFRAGVALGLTGQIPDAQALLKRAVDRYPESTFVRTVLAPATRAAMALALGASRQALDALQDAAPTELGTVAGLVPIYLRAETLRQTGAWRDALLQYRRVLQHRGVDPLSPVLPLSHLGAARVLAQAGDLRGSRAEYDALFALWREADPDLPILLLARREYDALGTAPETGTAPHP